MSNAGDSVFCTSRYHTARWSLWQSWRPLFSAWQLHNCMRAVGGETADR